MSHSDPYVHQRGDLICIGNSLVEFGFSRTENGALVSLLDKSTGYQFRHGDVAPSSLFRLALSHPGRDELVWTEGREAGHFEWSKEEDDRGAALILSMGSFPGSSLTVEVRIRLEKDSSLSYWRANVRHVGQASVYQLTCPILSGLVKVGEPTPGEAIAFPRHGEGYLYRDPYPVVDRLPLCAGAGPEAPDVGVGELHGLYPGQIAMQLCLYYNDRAGLYLAAHDAGQNVKSFDVAPPADGAQHPVFSVSHFSGERMGQDVCLDYDTVIGVFHGDWYDGADIYKGWATKQWWCEKKLWDRDIPEWMRAGFGVFEMSNYHIPEVKLNHSIGQIADVVNGLSRESGTPLLALVFNWEGGGGWTGPVGLFPPREGETEFKRAMQRLRDAGNYGFVYIQGGIWYLHTHYNPPFDSWERFKAEGQPYAVRNRRLEMDVKRDEGLLDRVRICPHTQYVQQLTASIFMECLNLGCAAVQIDCFPCVGSEACYDPSHGHLPGFGPWWSEAWGKLLAHIRHSAKAREPNVAIATEGISENFIPYVDLFDHRAGNMEYFGHYWRGDPMGGETIPLFNYVYNEYIGAYHAAYVESNRPEVLYWTRGLGKCLAQGIVPSGGPYLPEPKELNPVTIGFFKKVVRAAARECWPYLMFGEMLRPPKIDVPTLTASYLKFAADYRCADGKRRHEVQDRAVQHAAYRARDGKIGYVFANVSEEAVGFDVELSDYGADAESYDADFVMDGARERRLSNVQLPCVQRIEMPPLSVVLIEVNGHDALPEDGAKVE